jgi:prophage regulatory protein
VVLSQTKQAATATVRGLLQTEGGSAMAEVVAPLVRDLILRIETVVAITGLSKPSIYRLISERSFPKPLRLTAGARGWRLSEILGWIESLQREDEEHSHEARHGC